MRVDYMILEDKTKVRVLVCINALSAFVESTGKELTEFANGNMSLMDLRKMAYLSVKEGQAYDGKEFTMTEEEFGRVMSQNNIKEFAGIFIAQVGSGAEKKSAGMTPFWKRKKVHLR